MSWINCPVWQMGTNCGTYAVVLMISQYQIVWIIESTVKTSGKQCPDPGWKLCHPQGLAFFVSWKINSNAIVFCTYMC